MPRRLPAVFVAIAALWLVAPVFAQTGRASGIVRDANGKPIRSATIRAENPDASLNRITSTSDDKGRWAMIGLAIGEWQFMVDAPGFVRQGRTVDVRNAAAPPMTFTMVRDVGPLAGALEKNIDQRIADASALRDAGRFDQAIAAYQDIYSRNQKLTAIKLLVADTYRRKATQASDPALRRDSLGRAAAAYTELLEADAQHERALTELAAVQAELSSER